MNTPLPPELAEKINKALSEHLPRFTERNGLRQIDCAIEVIYPLIAAHVAKLAAEICNSKIPTRDGKSMRFRERFECAEAIKRKLGGKDEL